MEVPGAGCLGSGGGGLAPCCPPLLSWLLWGQWWLSGRPAPHELPTGRLYLHFGPQGSGGLNPGGRTQVYRPLLDGLPHLGTFGRGSAIPGARMGAIAIHSILRILSHHPKDLSERDPPSPAI